MKRMIALLLTVALGAGLLGGCARGQGKEDTLTRARWISLLAEKFGMYECQSMDPYYDDVRENDDIFKAVQASYEWGVLSTGSTLFKPAESATAGFVACSAALATGGVGNDMDNGEILRYAVEHGIVREEQVSEKLLNRKISYEDAKTILENAFQDWYHPQYNDLLEYETLDGVVDFTAQENYAEDYSVEPDTGSVRMSRDPELSPGDVYVLPANEENPFAEVFKAESVENTGDGYVIHNSQEEIPLEEVMQDFRLQETMVPDFTQAYIVDGNGRVLSGGNTAAAQTRGKERLQAESLLYNGEKPDSRQMGSEISADSIKIDIKLGEDLTVKGKITGNAVSFTIKAKIDKGENRNTSVSKSYELSDFSTSLDIDYGILKGLQYAKASYDYTVKETAEISVSSDSGKDKRTYNLSEKTADEILGSFMKDALDAKYTSKSFKIATISTPMGIKGVAGVVLEIRGSIDVKGTMQVNVISRTTQGVEYKKGSGIRAIKDKSVDKDIKADINGEAYVYVGLVAQVLGFNLVDVGAEVGLGTEAAATAHLLDYSYSQEEAVEVARASGQVSSAFFDKAVDSAYTLHGVTLKPVICTDVKVYFIFRITAGKNSLMGELAKLTLNVCGKDNGPFLYQSHWENFRSVGKECTLEFREPGEEQKETGPSDAADGKTEAMEGSGQAEQNMTDGTLDISTYSIRMKVLETCEIEIDSLPQGYHLEDLVWSAEDESIVSVNASGAVTALAQGSTTVIVQTSDGAFQVKCTVWVEGGENSARGSLSAPRGPQEKYV